MPFGYDPDDAGSSSDLNLIILLHKEVAELQAVSMAALREKITLQARNKLLEELFRAVKMEYAKLPACTSVDGHGYQGYCDCPATVDAKERRRERTRNAFLALGGKP